MTDGAVPDLVLRAVEDDDLAVCFADQMDEDARWMAAFTVRDPADRDAFADKWRRIRANPECVVRTVVVDGAVAGHVATYVEDGRTEVTYWLGKRFWRRGLATRALRAFLADGAPPGPLHARAAADNAASLRVLARCGFAVVGEDSGFAVARGADTRELHLRLDR